MSNYSAYRYRLMRPVSQRRPSNPIHTAHLGQRQFNFNGEKRAVKTVWSTLVFLLVNAVCAFRTFHSVF